MTVRSRNVARVIVCVTLLASATGLSFTHPLHDSSDDVRVHARRAAAFVSAISPKLDAGVHPAADPQLGVLWEQSHTLIMPVMGAAPGDLVDTFMQARGASRRHEAIDIRAPRGTPVRAVTDGRVVRLAQHDSGGITLYQLAPDGQTLFYYAHLDRYVADLHAGAAVRQGDVIGYVGDTGNPGPGNYHLHFEVMTMVDPQHAWTGRPRNPYPLLLRARG